MIEEQPEFESSKILHNKWFWWDFIANTFTMVEENFELQSSEMHQNEGFWDFILNTFTMVEENFEFQSSDCTRMKDFKEIS